MRKFLALIVILVLVGRGFAWNDKGHMVVARLASAAR